MQLSYKIFCIFIVATIICLAANGREVLTAPPVATNLIAVNNLKAVKMQEIFKPIMGYEGIYEVSNLGRVKSLTRIVRHGNSKRAVNERLMSLWISYSGYEVANLSNNKVCKHHAVHRLVGMAFIENPNNKRTINHINGIKTDNRVENLEWATHSENISHSYKFLNRKNPTTGKFGNLHHRSKPVYQFADNGDVINIYGSMQEAKRITGISQSCISMCCSGKQKKAGGYKWQT